MLSSRVRRKVRLSVLEAVLWVTYCTSCCDGFASRKTPPPPCLRPSSPRRSRSCTTCNPHRQLYISQTPEDEKWQVGDVKKDLNLLEQAIAFANADQDLQHQERIETLNYFAQQRRPVGPDIVQFLLRPLLFSFSLATILKLLVGSNLLLGRLCRRGVHTASVVHFWSLVVLAPILLLCTKRWTAARSHQPQQVTVPAELKGLDSEYYHFMTTTDWEDPATSTRDYVTCLLEQWVSTVVGIAIVSLCFTGNNTQLAFLVRIVVRCGVLASLHQYPKLWFELVRSKQPRPIPWPVWATQSLAKLLYTPWFAAVDLALLASQQQQLQWSSMSLSYGSGLVLTALLAFAARFVTPDKKRLMQALQFRPPVRLMTRAATLGWFFGRRQHIIDSFLSGAATLRALSIEEILVYFPWQRVATGVGLGVALIGPICHILAARKLVRIQYTHGLSLAMDVDCFKRAAGTNGTVTANDEERGEQRLLWRYKFTWREPQRIRVTLDQWRRGFLYWLLFSGSVEEKLRKEYRSKRQSETKSRGLTVLQRVAEERAKNPNAPMPDRTQWKKNAMDKVAQKHQDDYALKTFEDPLGIAVHQTFGIGLGLNFDHMSELKESELPNTRRLQTRAAKSAIKRVQEIYDAESARAALDKITDPAERDQKAAEFRLAAEEEIKFLAQRLSELIPNDFALGSGQGTDVQQFDSRSFTRASSHEYIMPSRRDRSPTLEQLLKSLKGKVKSPGDHIDYLNPMGDGSDNADDEFIEEWSKRYLASRGNSTKEGDDDQENAIETFLV